MVTGPVQATSQVPDQRLTALTWRVFLSQPACQMGPFWGQQSQPIRVYLPALLMLILVQQRRLPVLGRR